MVALVAVCLAQLQITGPPGATIGVVDGDTMQMLSYVMAANEDRRGNLYVTQRNIPYVAVFDSTGRRVATLGRAGGGPGEFAVPTYVGTYGDSVWVTDMQLNKLSLWGPDFTHVRDVIVPYEYPGTTTIFRTGNSVSLGQAGAWGFTAEARSAGSYAQVWQPWGADVATLLIAFDPKDRVKSITVNGRTTTVLSPLVETPFVVARDTFVYLIERAPVLTFRTVSSKGDISPATQVKLSREAVPSDMEGSFVGGLLERLKAMSPSSSRSETARLLSREIQLPDSSYFVVLGSIDARGDLWLRQAFSDGTARMYRIADDGSIRDTLLLPNGTAAVFIGRDHVWLLEHDRDDVPFLRRYRLTSS